MAVFVKNDSSFLFIGWPSVSLVGDKWSGFCVSLLCCAE